MATLDLTAFGYALKTTWPQKKVESMVNMDQPALAMMKREERFPGENAVIAVRYSKTLSRSASFAKAKARKRPSKGKKFTITRAKDYALASIDRETLMASQGNEGALLEALNSEMTASLDSLKRSMGHAIYRDGSGQIGTVSSGYSSGTTITLSNVDDIEHFDEDMYVVFASSTSAALRDGGAAVQVTSVNRDAGTFVIASAPSGLAASDVIFAEGDYESASDTNKLRGFEAWVPDSAPTLGSDSFFGVDRGSDTVRLAGSRVDCAGLPVTEALTKMAVKNNRHGGMADKVFVGTSNWEKLENLLGSKKEYVHTKVGEIGFDGIRVHAGKRFVEVYPDINCPPDKAYMLTWSSWALKSLGKAPHIFRDSAGKMWREDSEGDSVEIRTGYYGQQYTDAPGWNTVGTNFGQ